MGTLPIRMIKGFRLKIIPAENDHHRLLSVLVFVITLMIGMQAPMINCSGNMDLARPYLFRDFEMVHGYGPQRSQIPTLYHHQEQVEGSSHAQYSDSAEEASSEEGEDTQEYTAPIILDIDDPEVKARWIGLSDQQSFEVYDEEYEDEEEQRSLSSTEFQSRSSQQIRSSSSEKKTDKSGDGMKSSEKDDSGSSTGKESNRGIMDSFNFNPFSYWQGESEEDNNGQADLPQSGEYAYYPYTYDTGPLDYYYDPSSDPQLNDQQTPPMIPHMVPMQLSAPEQKPKPRPKKPKQKPKPKKPKQKPKPKPKPSPATKPKPMKVKKKTPQYSQQFHYQQQAGKPDKDKKDKLSIISEKLSKLNPFRYVQIQKPQIKIEKIHEDEPHQAHPYHGGQHQAYPHHGGQHQAYPHHGGQHQAHPHHGGPPFPPPKRRKKHKRPSPPQASKPKPKPKPPSMIQTMINKIKPKPKTPKSKHQKQPKPPKPQYDESNPELVMIFGEPFGGFSPDEKNGNESQDDYRNDDDDDDEDDEDNDDEDDDEEEDDEEDGEDYEDNIPQVTSISHEELPSGEMSNGEAVLSSDDGEAEAETTHQPVYEDDEGDYEDGVIGLTSGSSSSSNSGSNSNNGAETRTEEAAQQEKSIFGWKKKKRRRRRPHKRPARRPPNWKEYRPAPLFPEIPDSVSDTILRVVKHVGFLPEYEKNEKYGGHNKIKGKFTKTRPITLHHGLLTEVLRRRRR